MRKKSFSFLLALLLLCSFSVFASAEAQAGDVTFTAGGKMVEENFNIDQLISALQPGDKASYTVYIHNQNAKTTRWYMSNEVLRSLEDSAADGTIHGGVYGYKLSYVGPGGSQTLYDSDHVGGETVLDSRVGLHEATSNLEDYFFLDTLNSGESGVVTLEVSLEGETQGNLYQDTMAKIRMNFAVELKDGKEGGGTAVKTGDENNLFPYYVGMFVAGLLFLYLALDALTDRMYKKGRD